MKRCVDCGRITKGNMLLQRLDGLEEPLCDRCAGRDLLARTLRWLDPSRREIVKVSKLYAEIKLYGVDRDSGSEQPCPRDHKECAE